MPFNNKAVLACEPEKGFVGQGKASKPTRLYLCRISDFNSLIWIRVAERSERWFSGQREDKQVARDFRLDCRHGALHIIPEPSCP